ncbi:MAG: N-acetylmuramoyl-L-alanine amidase, partial [Turicibacter sp.]|nr:N-acetylmuramoyl-L-alanine amidase [Turicibacter sp.]
MKKQLKFHVVVRFCLFLLLLVSLFIPVHLASATPIQNIHWFDRFFKKDQKVIVIDAGHGGSDPGSIKGDILEKDINLKISFQLKRQLEKKGYRVVMTRQEDLSLSLSQRAKLANQSKGDLLVSIHQNSFKDG